MTTGHVQQRKDKGNKQIIEEVQMENLAHLMEVGGSKPSSPKVPCMPLTYEESISIMQEEKKLADEQVLKRHLGCSS